MSQNKFINDTLKSHQVEHFKTIHQILKKYPLFIDTSIMGSGKTYTTLLIAKQMSMSIGVICPKGGIMENWRNVAKLLGVKVEFVEGYDSLRGKRSTLITQQEYEVDDKSEIYYGPSDYFINLVKTNFMLVFDEFHKIKNKSTRSLCCRNLARACLKGGTCRLAFLSASPYDKTEHIINLLYTMGFITNPKLAEYNPGSGTHTLLGIQEAINKGMRINKEETQKLVNTTQDFRGTHGKEFLRKLFINSFKPSLVSCMPPPSIDATLNVMNGYYKLDNEMQEKLLDKAIQDLKSWYIINRKGAKINFNGLSLTLKDLEKAKLPLFVRKAKEILENDDYGKVVLFVNYIESLDYLKNEFKEYGVVDIQGKLSVEERSKNINAFQEPTSNIRVIVGTTLTGGVGVNLHDIDGRFPRTMFITPSFSMIEIHQATGRIYRVGTKSNANVRFVYGNIPSKNEESKIINALARKSEVIKEILDKQVESGVKFPSDYENEIEE
jgi:superfamily II DNA or RNA helicase